MLINVNVEVPDKENVCHRCNFFRMVLGIYPQCILHVKMLETVGDERYRKCPQCLNATRAEE
jgi:hypothetical protein